MLAKNPTAVILSGGPSSVYADNAPSVDAALFTAGVPVMGICYGFQLMAQGLGGEVAHTGTSEYGRTSLTIDDSGCLLAQIPHSINVWMSHGDSVTRAPEGFRVLASTAGAPVAAFENLDRKLVGVQWHPEVHHSESGQDVLEHFLRDVAGCRADWTAANIVDEQVARIREQVGDRRVICGLSGGVDSAVAAVVSALIGALFLFWLLPPLSLWLPQAAGFGVSPVETGPFLGDGLQPDPVHPEEVPSHGLEQIGEFVC